VGHPDEAVERVLHWLRAPSSHELGEYALGLLPPERVQQLEHYLHTHPEAHHDLALLRSFLHAVPVQPQHAEAPAERGGGLVERVRSLVATLKPAHSPLAPAALGLRGDEDTFYVYQAEEIEITLEVQADESGQPMLIGAVSGTDPHGLQVRLYEAHRCITTVAVDEEGDFLIPTLPPARYTVIVDGPTLDLAIPDIEVRSATL
jgi:hypothetical protein